MHIGIYLNYPPRSNLSAQGLGRHLQYLSKGLAQHPNTSLTILTPSWLRKDIAELLALPEAQSGNVKLLAPGGLPFALRLFEMLDAWLNNRWLIGSGFRILIERIKRIPQAMRDVVYACISFLLVSRTPLQIAIRLAILLPAALAGTLLFILALPVLLLYMALRAIAAFPGLRRKLRSVSGMLHPFRNQIKNVSKLARIPFVGRLYDDLCRAESALMLEMANALSCDVWYSPAAFWPEVTSIKSPVVVCVPDISPCDYPVHYAIKHPLVTDIIDKVVETIQRASNFITYEKGPVFDTLVNEFGVHPDQIHPVPHARNRLDHLIDIAGAQDAVNARRQFANSLIDGHQAVHFQGDPYLRTFSFRDAKYLLYPTQVRPNKNLMNLLRAYEILLRKKYRHVKLFLTGNTKEDQELHDFIASRRLQYEVIEFHHVSEQVLAALYHRAELVVNSSLFEGGFPFTFSEGLSVGTPSVQSDLPEVRRLMGEELSDVMLFDPFNPENIADVIARGLDQREALFARQMKVLDQFEHQDWGAVANKYVEIFNKVC